MLEVINGSFGYSHDTMIFQDLNFKIKEGEILSILGPNGCGKTSLLKCLMGITELKKGNILLNGYDKTKIKKKRLDRNIGYVPQNQQLLYSYTVLDMTLMGRARFIPTFHTPSPMDVKIARESLIMAGIGDYESRIFSELSGGEKQLVLIARAIASKADILIFDEPTSALDYKNQYLILELLYKLAKDEGYTIIMTTHHPEHALILSDKVLLMDNSGHSHFGDVTSVLTKKNIHELYCVDVEIVSIFNGKDSYKGIVPLVHL